MKFLLAGFACAFGMCLLFMTLAFASGLTPYSLQFGLLSIVLSVGLAGCLLVLFLVPPKA